MDWWRWLVLLGFLTPIALFIWAAIVDARNRRRQEYPNREAHTEEIQSWIRARMQERGNV